MLDGEEDEEGAEESRVFFAGSILTLEKKKPSPPPGKPSPQLPSGSFPAKAVGEGHSACPSLALKPNTHFGSPNSPSPLQKSKYLGWQACKALHAYRGLFYLFIYFFYCKDGCRPTYLIVTTW